MHFSILIFLLHRQKYKATTRSKVRRAISAAAGFDSLTEVGDVSRTLDSFDLYLVTATGFFVRNVYRIRPLEKIEHRYIYNVFYDEYIYSNYEVNRTN